MTNRSKAKGTRAETAAVRECHAWGLNAKRHDMGQREGDIELDRIILQVKDNNGHYGRVWPPLTWLAQTADQGARAGKPAVLLVKPTGLGYQSVRSWHAWVPLGFVSIGVPIPGVDVNETVYADPVRLWFSTILTLLGGTDPAGTP